MLGDTAVAVNPKDERYTQLHGKKVLLPLMNREIPIITDDLAQPEFGTGAVKVTPAHDPNDFEAGLRHNLPQIEVIDEHNKMNANAGPYAGLERFAARARVVEDLAAQSFLVGTKDYTVALGKCDRSRNHRRAAALDAVVHQDQATRRKSDRRRRNRRDHDRPRQLSPDVSQLDEQHPRLVHLASTLVGTSHSGMALLLRRGDRRARDAREMPEVRNAQLEQDTDVLDTWFSSGLLPFTTLGWPEKTRDQQVFYPTTLLITAYEILFSGWHA